MTKPSLKNTSHSPEQTRLDLKEQHTSFLTSDSKALTTTPGTNQKPFAEQKKSLEVTGPMKLKKRHKKLLHMLTFKRPHASNGEKMFVDHYIKGIKNAEADDFGNIHVKVGKSQTLFSSHVDTVHSAPGKQKICYDENTGHAFLDPVDAKSGNCLGADDGAGVWLMMEMIKAEVPGYYIFHRGEECGGLGSRWLRDNKADLLKTFKRAIAFDRKGLRDIIDTQRGKNCASRDFCDELAGAMHEAGIPEMDAAVGSFTDTANYDGIIPECTNLSVGYYWQHGPRETLDVTFLEKMRKACIAVNWEELPWVRSPKKPVVQLRANTVQREELEQDLAENELLDGFYEEYATCEDLLHFVRKNPYAAAKAMEEAGITYGDITYAVETSKEHLALWLQ